MMTRGGIASPFFAFFASVQPQFSPVAVTRILSALAIAILWLRLFEVGVAYGKSNRHWIFNSLRSLA